MADERLRTKSELKRLFTNLKGKPITDEMISILIDVLWRDKITQRSAGFEYAGSGDVLISFNSSTRTFTVVPFDVEIETHDPRYGIYSFTHFASFHRMYGSRSIQIPNEEGLYLIYFDAEPSPGNAQILTIQKNPDASQLQNIIQNKVSVASIYWDATAGEVLYFGNDKHGSQWNSQIQWYLHSTVGARRSSGLQFENLEINEDGSADSHAQFVVTGGIILHDDFPLTIPAFGNSIPILYFLGGLPRFLSNSGFACYAPSALINYNSGSVSLAQATENYHVMYHVFAVNEHENAGRKIVSVMGQNEYETLAEAHIAVSNELDLLFGLMPQQGRCYLGTLIYQTSSNYTNSVKGRIVAHIGGGVTHPPVSIAPGSENNLIINEKQEISFNAPPPKDGLEEPGFVIWLYGLTFAVTRAVYYLLSILHISPSSIMILDDADATFPRIDVFTLNLNSAVEIIKGTPAAEPQKPSIDPTTHIELTFVLIPALATEPEDITDEIVYNENTEWVGTANGVTVDFDSTVSPFLGSKCANVGIISKNDTITFTASEPKNVADYKTLSQLFKFKSAASTKNSFNVTFLLSGAAVSNEGGFSWNLNEINVWQSLAVLLSDFTFTSTTFDAIQFKWIRTQGTTEYEGFYLDYIKLQRGISIPTFTDTVELIGDVIATGKTGTPINTVLKNIITPGSFGAATKSLNITVDSNGRITAISENDIEGSGGLSDAPSDGNKYARKDAVWVTIVDGVDGNDGADGTELEISTSGGYVVWRYAGDIDWINLFLIPADGSNGSNGTDGANAYAYIAYASDASGTDFTTTFDAALTYIAILSTDTEIVTPVANDFAGLWANYQGSGSSQYGLIQFIEGASPATPAAGSGYVYMRTYGTTPDKVSIFAVKNELGEEIIMSSLIT